MISSFLSLSYYRSRICNQLHLLYSFLLVLYIVLFVPGRKNKCNYQGNNPYIRPYRFHQIWSTFLIAVSSFGVQKSVNIKSVIYQNCVVIYLTKIIFLLLPYNMYVILHTKFSLYLNLKIELNINLILNYKIL